MKKKDLEKLVEAVIEEEIGGLIGSFFFGKDRNGGNKNPPEWQKTQDDFDAFTEEFKSLMPEIQTQVEYRKALKLAKALDANEVGASFEVYDILWPILKREGWSGDEDDAGASYAVFYALRAA